MYLPRIYLEYSAFINCIIIENAYTLLIAVASRNNDRTVSGKAYAWRLLGMMPAVSKAATVAQTSEWRAERRTRLYHSCIEILVEQINDLTGRDVHWVCRQIGATLSCFYRLFIHGRWWGIHCNYVSHDTVRKLLVSQGSGYRPDVPFQRHTGDSRWVWNTASAAAQSRWNGTWKMQGPGMLMLSYMMYILVICILYTMHIQCTSNIFEWHIQKI